MSSPVPMDRTAPSPPIERNEFVRDTLAGMQVLEVLVSDLEKAGFESRCIAKVELAFIEALVNAVRHGNQNDPRKAVRIHYRIDFLSLRLSLEDEGRGFRPDEVADPRSPENLNRPGGRGLLLIKSAMTDVEFIEPGNQVVMRLLKHAA